VEDRHQHRFPWGALDNSREDAPEVVLDRETTAAAIALLGRALLAVVRAREETADER
jgi:hypothetical protein